MNAPALLATYQLRQREYLLRISRAMTSRLDLPSLLKLILNSAAEMVGCRAGLIVLLPEDSEFGRPSVLRTRFQIRAIYGIPPQSLTVFEPLLDIPPLLEEDEGDTPRVTALDPFFLDLQGRVRQLEEKLGISLGQVVGLPLLVEDELLGIIYLFRGEYAFTQLDWQFLQGFADQAAIAVRNARLYHQLERERSRLAAVIENSADGILILDAERRVVVINQALSDLVGLTSAQVVGLPCQDVLPLEGVTGDDVCQAEATPNFTGKPDLRCEGDLVRPGKKRITVAITFTPLYDDAGRLVNIIVNVHDITRFREEEVIKSTFTSIISHELKTPVALIKGYAQTLARPDARWDSETARSSLEIIEEEADRLLVRLALQAERVGDLAGLEGLEAHLRVERLLDDRGRVAVGDLLDLHPAELRRHERRHPDRPVEGDPEVELLGDVGRLLDEHLLHLPPLRAGLVRHELHPDDPLGGLVGFVGGPRELDAAPLAAPAGVDLGLHDGLAAEVLGDLTGLFRAVGDVPLRGRDTVAAEDLLRLVLVDFHSSVPSSDLVRPDGRGGF